jgi:glutamate racemase
MDIPKGGIAFFDSGIGGLTVMADCQKYFKNEIFYYYGDNRHAPYGNLSIRKIKKYVHRAFQTFEKLNVKAVVIACNTVTATCIEELRKEYSFPIVGAEPSVLKASRDAYKQMHCEKLHNKFPQDKRLHDSIYVLTTRRTYESERFHVLCKNTQKRYPACNLQLFPCDELAGVIEKNILNPNFDYAAYLPKGQPRSVVLGCTHYIYIKKKIEEFYHCPCVDGNDGIARRLLFLLRELELWKGENIPNTLSFRENSNHFNPKTSKNQKCLTTATTFNPKNQTNKKSIKNPLKLCLIHRSRVKGDKAATLLSKKTGNIVYFCGSSKRYNAFISKQMFGF